MGPDLADGHVSAPIAPPLASRSCEVVNAATFGGYEAAVAAWDA